LISPFYKMVCRTAKNRGILLSLYYITLFLLVQGAKSQKLRDVFHTFPKNGVFSLTLMWFCVIIYMKSKPFQRRFDHG